ncbi:uracil-DNA glycosylase family protein [Pseudoalteromonas sp. CnMc7-15]|uniref:uracil-DNA glycosylase family protein n=1 Tax=unclassified Pseudoalteromonas TaxID=194690 RepID=UPI001EF68206|nr:uracil-DNA glycosylase family protein [Pseudoalteromonas sp. CnMc7-15]MCG7565538.1 uracil-DNA glycosylase family protein [Pseudoalteromonas sp. CnMc7-15]
MQLADKIRACTLCAEHLPLAPKPIIQLDSEAPILIAGQAPGVRAHQAGKPFADASGDRLRQWLGVDEQQFYNPRLFAIAPMGFCYPGTAQHGDLAPREECAVTWREQVLAALPKRQLTLVLGQYAMAYHLPKRYKTLTAAVQDWHSYWPHTLVLPHPSPRNNRWFKRNPWFEQEILPHLQQRVADLL